MAGICLEAFSHEGLFSFSLPKLICQHCPYPRENSASDGAECRIFLHSGYAPGYKLRIETNVLIQRDNEFSMGSCDSLIHTCCKALILLINYVEEIAMSRLHSLQRGIPRTVINHNTLDRRIALRVYVLRQRCTCSSPFQ